MRCPGCKQQGTFENISSANDVGTPGNPSTYFGQRRCPNPQCRTHIFFVSNNSSLVCYPPEKIDFDSSNVPATVVAALEESITCHANGCFVSSGIMIRKTLEEICRDRGAKGKDLKDKIKSLSSLVVLPKELFDGLDHLRLLGNDAAHIESKTFNEIGQTEIEISISFTKEVIKAIYQYADLLAKIKSLTKTNA